jgi:uncharacterized protein (TIRG00374 family)
MTGLGAAGPADLIDEVRDADGARSVLTARAMQACDRGEHGRHRLARIVVVALVVTILVVEAVVIAPHIAGARDALSHPRWEWLAFALFCEALSMASFARVQRRMLSAGGLHVPLYRAIAVTFAANAMSVTLPAGPVVSSGYTFRRMRSWGASAPLVAWGMLASGVLSTIALALIGAFGVTLAGGNGRVPIVVVEILAMVAIALGLRRLARRPDLLLRIGKWMMRWVNRVLGRPPLTGQERVVELLDELLVIRPRSRDWLLGLYFAAMNWILDLACLIAACRAVGAHGPTVGVAIIAYAGGMAASSLPLIPGGVGLVDGALLLALTHGGLALGTATAGVVVYRLISFVLVAAVGWMFWFLIRQRDRAKRRRSILAGYAGVAK